MKLIKDFLKIKSRKGSFKRCHWYVLLVAAFLLLPYQSNARQNNVLPGYRKKFSRWHQRMVLEVSPDDYLKKKLPPNEFEGTYSTIKIGLGYIVDGATYIQNEVFKQQMDSAGLEF